jgi:hypothetical protein
MFPVYSGKCLLLKAVRNLVVIFSQGRSKVADDARPGAELAETTAKRLPCWGFHRTGKVMGQVYRCCWRICREINVFSRFKYHMIYVLYPSVTYLLTLPHMLQQPRWPQFEVLTCFQEIQCQIVGWVKNCTAFGRTWSCLNEGTTLGRTGSNYIKPVSWPQYGPRVLPLCQPDQYYGYRSMGNKDLLRKGSGLAKLSLVTEGIISFSWVMCLIGQWFIVIENAVCQGSKLYIILLSSHYIYLYVMLRK